jgi:hypothetical protein
MRRAAERLLATVRFRQLAILWVLVLAATAALSLTEASTATTALVFGALGAMLFTAVQRPDD